MFQLTADLCARYGSATVEAITGVGADAVERTARLLWEHRPVAFYAWSGVEQHSNATQTARAIGLLYALTGSFDAPGGNVLFPGIKKNIVDGRELLSADQRAKALGLPRRPLGPSQWEFVTSDDLYTAALRSTPYRVRGLVGFGANLLLSHGDSRRGREALAALDFYVHADLFMNPTAELADIVLPAASAFETEALAVGFEVSTKAQSRLQLRRPLVEPRGEARADTRIVFDLATRLGLGDHFWNGDIEAGFALPARTERRSRSNACEQSRAVWTSRSSPAIASTRSRPMASPVASTPRHARSSSTRKPCSSTATRRCPNSRSR